MKSNWKETISNKKINLLHCTTQYPAPFKDINLLNLVTLKKSFNIEIGYSDHSIGNEVSLAAVAMEEKLLKNISHLINQ